MCIIAAGPGRTGSPAGGAREEGRAADQERRQGPWETASLIPLASQHV